MKKENNLSSLRKQQLASRQEAIGNKKFPSAAETNRNNQLKIPDAATSFHILFNFSLYSTFVPYISYLFNYIKNRSPLDESNHNIHLWDLAYSIIWSFFQIFHLNENVLFIFLPIIELHSLKG